MSRNTTTCVVSPHFLPALFIHVAGAAPSIRWMEISPLEPLFDNPVGMDADGNISPPDTPGHGIHWAHGAWQEYRVAE